MKSQIARIGLLIGWALLLSAVLSIAQWPGDWGHGVCGPWGCGPPLQALVACHLAWVVLLMPLAILSRHLLSPRMVRWFGLLICSLGIGLLLFIVLREWNFAPEYRWQRIGFVAITQVDFPSVQLVVVGVFLCLTRIPRVARIEPHQAEASGG